ncbi:hypothetical protein CTI12_AA254430 [Artemisia annua]|uniref:Helitron helicase-like domain-containing protein n=1 Tax=Artemisia annua TaxID=35608 RepID=A0A2U1NKP8_ARTAN|nr:hypothetical protein CTI12_AA254430 [Artemisia annua]
MRTKGKAKIRTTNFQNICLNNVCDVSESVVSPSVETDMPRVCVPVVVDHHERSPVGSCSKRKVPECPLGRDITFGKRMACGIAQDGIVHGTACSGFQGASVGVPVSCLRQVSTIHGPFAADGSVCDSQGSGVGESFRGPVVLDFANGMVLHDMSNSSPGSHTVSRSNGKRVFNTFASDMAETCNSSKRRCHEGASSSALLTDQLSADAALREQQIADDGAPTVSVTNTNGKRRLDDLLENAASEFEQRKSRRVPLPTCCYAACTAWLPYLLLNIYGCKTSFPAAYPPGEGVTAVQFPEESHYAVPGAMLAGLPSVSATAQPNVAVPCSTSRASVADSAQPNSLPTSQAIPRSSFEQAGAPVDYRSFGPCSCVCSHCHAKFWYEERLAVSTRRSGPLYHHCCRGGKVQLFLPFDYPEYIQQLFLDEHFLRHIRAYNQMFGMTSLGATVDDTVNNGRGPYVFKVSGQIYHCIGRFCPDDGVRPRFLQLYIHDTANEVRNRLENFTTNGQNPLRQDIVEGLIQLLDQHNALVQLFRTARDKLRDVEVPEFKVRLFHVVGSAQHELPTADEVGAIVFDSGAETEPDFDENTRSHQIRARLENFWEHFSRLMASTHAQSSSQPSEVPEQTADQQSDARARAKGKQIVVDQEEIDIMKLKPSDLGKPLDLKVYRKWISKNIPDPSPTGICFMLLDKKGGAIQAAGQLPDMRQLDTRLQLDGCYRIQGYGCKRTDNWQRTLDNDVTLLFGRYTQVAPIQDDGFPKHYFSFAAYNEVCRRADTREPILTDYIGILRNIGVIREFGDITTNIISRRNIEIQNLNGNVVMLTLWNELATGFPITRLDEMEQPVVIAASSCWAKRHAGAIQLSTTPATAIYLNPEVPETDSIEEAYKQLVGAGPSAQPHQIQALDVEDQGQPQAMTLAAIMESASQNITAYLYTKNLAPLTINFRKTQQQYFTTDAVIVKIDQSRGWFFNRCRGCGNPIADHMPHLHCHEPGTKPSPNYSYCFRATLADVTGSIVVACYSPAAHSLVPTITELLSYVPEKDPYTLPPIIKDLENTRRRFRIHVGKGSRRGYPNFILDHATDAPTPLSEQTPTTPEEATSSTTAVHHITEEEPTEMTPGTTSPPPIAATPTPTMLRITGPPENTEVHPTETSQGNTHGAASTSSDTPAEARTAPQEVEHGTARRQLFRESHELETEESLKKARHD